MQDLIENLKKASLKEIIIVTGHHADHIEEFAKTHSYPLTIINQFAVLGDKEYGTACPIKIVRDIIGNENFLAVAGDNIYKFYQNKKFKHQEYNVKFGANHNEQPEKRGVMVKPKEFISNLVNVSLYKFTPEIFKAIDKIKLSPRGEYEITDAITLLAKEHKVKVVPMDNFWMDFGKLSDIPKLSRFIKNNGHSH